MEQIHTPYTTKKLLPDLEELMEGCKNKTWVMLWLVRGDSSSDRAKVEIKGIRSVDLFHHT